MRKWNFSAGPATIPESVLKETQSELLEFKPTGMSVMEMSHRSKDYGEIANAARDDLVELLDIPDSHDVLFLQGGATLQFGLIPMNFAHLGIPEYLETGTWSTKAIKECSKVCDLNICASSEESNFTNVPELTDWKFRSSNGYFHYVANETIQGNAIHDVPSVENPIIADMSSVILAEPIDVSKFSMIYAGAQKNIGPAGLTIAIISKDLLSSCNKDIPNIMNYDKHAQSGSMLNTPPTFAWYMAGKVFKWLKSLGGLEAAKERNYLKASTLYDFIDRSDFFSNPVAKNNRSIMNIPFILKSPELDGTFLKEAESENLLNLKGHRSVGGMRASIYNAMPQEAIDDLIAFMEAFESKYG